MVKPIDLFKFAHFKSRVTRLQTIFDSYSKNNNYGKQERSRS